MEIASNEFLSCTVGADDKYSGICRGYLLYHVLHLKQSRRLTYHFLSVDLLLEDLGLLDKRNLFCSVLDRDQDTVEVERLLDEIKCAFLYAFYGCVDVPMTGNHDDRRIHSHPGKAVEDFHAVHFRHLDVTEYHAVFFLIHHGTALCTVFRHIHIVSFICQNLLQGVTDGPFVVNDQYFHIFYLLFVIGCLSTIHYIGCLSTP